MKHCSVFAMAVVLLLGCGGGTSRSQDKKKKPDLRVTEVGLLTPTGESWVEIRNDGTKEATIARLILDFGPPNDIRFRSVIDPIEAPLKPGEYRKVVVPDPPSPGQVKLRMRDGRTIDRFAWPLLERSPTGPLDGSSYGVTSRETGQILTTATPGKENVDPPTTIIVNDVCADNESAYENPDAPGEFDDWIELHNPGDEEVDLTGMTLSNDARLPMQWTFPDGTKIPAGGFLILHADNRRLPGLHLPFTLPAEDGEVFLFAADGGLVDAFLWDQMGEDRSRGRDGEGAAEWVAWRELTPAGPNLDGQRDRTDTPAHRVRRPDYELVFGDRPGAAPTAGGVDLTIPAPDSIGALNLEMENVEWGRMIVNLREEFEASPDDPRPLTFECTVRAGEQIWEHVGIRFQVGENLTYPLDNDFLKLPLRLDFSYFGDEYPEFEDQRFFGLRHLMLNNGVSDPTYLREYLTLSIMRETGVHCSRVAPLEVHVDTGIGAQYWGLYANVEVVDDIFLTDRFGDGSGNYYRPDERGASLETLNANDKPIFFEHSFIQDADFSDLEELVFILNRPWNDLVLRRFELERVLDVDSVLRWLAVSSVVANVDSYATDARNYYLYSDPLDGRFRFISWNHHRTLGSTAGTFAAGTVHRWDILAPYLGRRPLIEALLEIPGYYLTYLNYVDLVRFELFDEVVLEDRVQEWHEALHPFVLGDGNERFPYTLLNLVWHFRTGLEESLTPRGWREVRGLLPFFRDRFVYLGEALN